MGTLTDYIKWRGDLEFWQDGFNDFDNLVLAAISYVDLDEIFANSKTEVLTLKAISDDYFGKYAAKKKVRDNSVLKETPNIMRQAAATRRYSKIFVRNYVSHIDVEKTLQFAAMEFLLPDGTSYVAYRGTDDTIVGWKEDFLLAVSEVEAEKEAVAFIEKVAADSDRSLRVGGHSKGGHLAVYAAAMASKEVKGRLLMVYSNDGPGFSKEFTKSKEAKSIADKITSIVPEESIVGMIMEPVVKPTVIKSTNKAVAQHDLLSWCMDGMNFDKAADVSAYSKNFYKALKEWLEAFEMEKRVDYVNDLFAVLEASDADTLSGIMEGGIKAWQKMGKRLNELSPETKEKTGSIIKLLFEGIIKINERKIFN